MHRCGYCETPIPDDANPRRRYCTSSHRVMAHYKRRREELHCLRAVVADLGDEGRA
ncbi:hypothetical protein [Micromonospora sp. NPDC005161]